MERLFTVLLQTVRPAAREMYLRCDNQTVSTDTYFGCFDCRAYARHTDIHTVRACAKGNSIRLIHVDRNGRHSLIGEGETVDAALAKYRNGYLYMEWSAGDAPEAVWYEGAGNTRPVKITIIICTFRRETTVQKIMELLSVTIQNDPLLKSCVDVLCIDNGQTLKEVPACVRLISNPNYGGSGGYARGMMEAGECTHFWLMDDDIEFEPAILRRVVTFLKYRKQETLHLAAGMFSFEQPTIQYEATAVFSGYTFHSNCAELDFTDSRSLLMNRIPVNSRNLYSGWWSMVMLNRGELPMPFFIMLDDAEYGLRGQDYAVMNGFGVWHEAFSNKANAWKEYYTTRNMLIIQSMYPDLGHSAFMTMSLRLIKSLAYDDPKCMEAVLKGLEDFLEGADAFRSADPVSQHDMIVRSFGSILKPDVRRKNMLRMAAKNLWHNWHSVGLCIKGMRLLRGNRRNSDWSSMKTKAFWTEYLKLKPYDRGENA